MTGFIMAAVTLLASASRHPWFLLRAMLRPSAAGRLTSHRKPQSRANPTASAANRLKEIGTTII